MTCMLGPRARRTGFAWGAAAAPLSLPPPAAPAAAGEEGIPPLWLLYPPWGRIWVRLCCWACSP